MRFLAAIAFILGLAGAAQAQQAVHQSGSVTPGHGAMWTTNGVIQDAGTAANGKYTSLGTTGQGPTICANSAPISQPYNQICLGATSAGMQISLNNNNGATGGLAIILNGVTLPFTGPFLPLAGGTMSGKINTLASSTLSAGLNLPAGTAPTSPVNGDLWSTTGGLYVRIGGTTVGPLLGTGFSASANGVGQWSSGTFSASTSLANGTTATTQSISDSTTKLATTAFVQSIVQSASSGLTVHTPVVLATATALPANTYNNGTSGVGATLTGNSFGALTVDGTSVTTTQRILVKNESTPANNGIYVVTTVGDVSHDYVLTRSTDADVAGTGDPNKIGYGTYVLVTSGSTNINSSWIVNSSVTTIGTDAINWIQFSASFTGVTSANIIAGTGMTSTGTCNSTLTISCTLNSSWTITGSDQYSNNAGNVGIGTSTPNFDGSASKILTVNNSTAHEIAEIGAAGNASSVGDFTGAISFVNSVLGTTDKRIAQINAQTAGATNGGDINFVNWNAGTGESTFQITHNGTVNIGTSVGSQSGQVCLNGGCITALSPPPCTPAANVGLSPSNIGSTNSSAWSTWASGISGAGACLQFGAGVYEFSGNISASVPNGRAAITIKGLGNQITLLDWSGGGGMTLTLTNCNNTVHVRDLSIGTGTTNTGDGLFVNNTASCSNLNQTFVSSDVTNVSFYGNDRSSSAAGSFYWATALHVFGITYFNVINSDFEGAQSHAGKGVLYESNSTTIGGAMYITNSNFYALGDGVIYGNFAQGIQITNGSCVGVLICVFAPSGESQLDVLELDQFDMSTAYQDCLLIESPITNIQITGGTCIDFGGDGTNGITLAQSAGFSIVGMAFINGSACTGSNAGNSCVALYVNNAAGGSNAGIVTGNQFINWTFGVQLDTASARTNVQSNGYSGNGTNTCQLPFSPSFPSCSSASGGNQFGGGSP